MSKYKVGDKVVMEITDRFKNAYGHEYYSLLNSIYSTDFIEEKTEFLTFYTEPLEAKIRRQAAEITRLLAENERLKAEQEKMSVKIDDYELYGDQHEEEYNQAFNQGAETAWELARKILSCDDCGAMDYKVRQEIFETISFRDILKNHTYPEAAAKVEAWEKAKEEIKDDEDCLKCQFFEKHNDEYPCSHCCYCYTSKFKQIGGEE